MHLLVIRTSAMGDVALTVPVVAAVADAYPGVKLTIVTHSSVFPFFEAIAGVNLFGADFKGRHKGVRGIFRFLVDLKKLDRIDWVIDLHDVLRTKLLRWLLRITGVRFSAIDKGHTEKKAAISGRTRGQLKHVVNRYCDVFAAAGFPVVPGAGPWMVPQQAAMQQATIRKAANLVDASAALNIGVAPYARHELKRWPDENMVQLLQLISAKSKSRFWLFGGPGEVHKLNHLQQRVPGSSVIAGSMSLREELAVMRSLDVMISMDSSNMHMAALAGVRVLSIWGATDPLVGFGAWQLPDEYAVRIPSEELSCRPCTVYGRGRCRRGDLACMNWLTPERVFRRMVDLKLV